MRCPAAACALPPSLPCFRAAITLQVHRCNDDEGQECTCGSSTYLCPLYVHTVSVVWWVGGSTAEQRRPGAEQQHRLSFRPFRDQRAGQASGQVQPQPAAFNAWCTPSSDTRPLLLHPPIHPHSTTAPRAASALARLASQRSTPSPAAGGSTGVGVGGPVAPRGGCVQPSALPTTPAF